MLQIQVFSFFNNKMYDLQRNTCLYKQLYSLKILKLLFYYCLAFIIIEKSYLFFSLTAFKIFALSVVFCNFIICLILGIGFIYYLQYKLYFQDMCIYIISSKFFISVIGLNITCYLFYFLPEDSYQKNSVPSHVSSIHLDIALLFSILFSFVLHFG